MSRLNELIQQYCPDGVEFVQIGQIAQVGTGSSNGNEADEDGAFPFFIRSQTVKRKNDYEYDEEAIIIPGEGGIGDIFHYINGKYALHQRVYRIHFTIPSINTKFAFYYLKSAFKQFILMKAVSATVVSIRKPMIEGFPIPIPPLPVQEEIVRILDTFTELQAELQAELQKRLQQYNYYRDNLLSFEGRTDVEWKKLGELGHNLDRKRKPITAGKREAGNIPYYGASGIVDYVKDYIFDGDYLLVSEDGANLLTRTYPIAFSISGKNWVNNHAHIIEFVERATRKYVEYYLNSIDLSSWISAGAQPKLTQDNLNKIPIPVPPLSEQQRIVDILDRFDALTTDITAGLPAEIEARRKQYEYYRDKLLTFKQKV